MSMQNVPKIPTTSLTRGFWMILSSRILWIFVGAFLGLLASPVNIAPVPSTRVATALRMVEEEEAAVMDDGSWILLCM